MSDNSLNVDGDIMMEVSNMFDTIENIFSCHVKVVKVVGTWYGSCEAMFWWYSITEHATWLIKTMLLSTRKRPKMEAMAM